MTEGGDVGVSDGGSRVLVIGYLSARNQQERHEQREENDGVDEVPVATSYFGRCLQTAVAIPTPARGHEQISTCSGDCHTDSKAWLLHACISCVVIVKQILFHLSP